MAMLNRLDCRGTHVLIEYGGRFAVVEERAGKIYGLSRARRSGYPCTPEGVVRAIGADWKSEIAATRLFDEVTREAEHLAQRIW
jgi:hypothetical protein